MPAEPPPKLTITSAEARRMAIAAQGFNRRNAATRSSWNRVAAAIGEMGLLQLDSVNVLVRSHYLPVFSRVGDYDRAGLDRHSFERGARRQFFEYWAHEASLLPFALHPLMRWRMDRARRHFGFRPAHSDAIRRERGYIRAVLKEVERRGAIAASELDDPGERSGAWWGWHKGKRALEHLFHAGEIAVAGRRGSFERVYDLAERVIPSEVMALPTPTESDAIRALAAAGADAFGVATEMDIRDYFRLPVGEARRAIGELVEEGTLLPVSVHGWDRPAYLAKDAAAPRRVSATALLSPFDPLVWFRPRTERLFGFHYRIEIYTPQAKRRFGYYVLPFLHEGRLAARVDLKADRAAGALDVRGAYAEADGKREGLVEALAGELRHLARWLALGTIRVAPRGDLAAALDRLV